MFFKNATIYKTYATEIAAIRFVAKNFPDREDISVELHGNIYMVVGR